MKIYNRKVINSNNSSKGYKNKKRSIWVKDMKIHHIGIIIKDIKRNIERYKKMGYHQISDIIFDNIQFIKVVFLKSSDGIQIIELIESLGDMSTIHKSNYGYHHICYDVSDIPDFINYFKTLKVGRIFTKPIIAPAIDDKLIVFACLNNGTFIEFIIGRDIS